MRYLLDVNVLIALAHTGHALHRKAIDWYVSAMTSAVGLHTCAITELGFVRVAVVTGLQSDIRTAQDALAGLKSSSRIRFELLADDLGAQDLPAFVRTPPMVTDGHLLSLARRNSIRLATLDRRVPGAIYIGA